VNEAVVTGWLFFRYLVIGGNHNISISFVFSQLCEIIEAYAGNVGTWGYVLLMMKGFMLLTFFMFASLVE